jgi:hypothetical protein
MRTLTHLTITASLLLLASMGRAGTPIDETRAMSADGVVDIELTNAIIRITGTDSNEFHIVGELGNQVEDFELEEEEGNIHFEEEWRRRGNRNWDWGDRSSFGFGCWFGNDNDECDEAGENFSRLEVQVPRGSVLRLAGTNGDVMVSGLTNNTNIEVVNASVLLVDLDGTVRAETVNGSLDAENLRGRVSLETTNGEITDTGSSPDRVVYDVVNGDITSDADSADVSAEAVNGDIELTLANVRDLHVGSVGGRIEVETSLMNDANVEISTVSGRVNLRVPESTSARFRVDTNGRINNELTDDEPERENRYGNSRNLNFSLNGGEADVDISAVSGSVTLRRK